MTRLARTSWVAAAVLAGAAAAALPHVAQRSGDRADAMPSTIRAVGTTAATATSADGLRIRIGEMEKRLRADRGDLGAAVALADALLRQARATSDGRPANRAAQVLEEVLNAHPAQYDALRMLGAIHLSRHRFRDALAVARQARDLRPNDAWNYGVMGDALLELGDYREAFEAFDRMAAMRPNADAYARVSYARELGGDLVGALEAMRLAEKATSVDDPEAKAWYAAHVGELHLAQGRLDLAEREYRYSAFVFPNYPHAMIGLAKVKNTRGDRAGALAAYLDQFKRTPSLDLAARIGDLYAEMGDRGAAARYYDLAEETAGPAIAQTEANLALFLAEHDRKIAEAVAIADRVAAQRHDIFTEGARAWALYKAGRLDEAAAAADRSLRTGTRDRRLLAHAAAIRDARRRATSVALRP